MLFLRCALEACIGAEPDCWSSMLSDSGEGGSDNISLASNPCACVFRDMFERVAKSDEDSLRVEMSFLEIYIENVYDLLAAVDAVRRFFFFFASSCKSSVWLYVPDTRYDSCKLYPLLGYDCMIAVSRRRVF